MTEAINFEDHVRRAECQEQNRWVSKVCDALEGCPDPMATIAFVMLLTQWGDELSFEEACTQAQEFFADMKRDGGKDD